MIAVKIFKGTPKEVEDEINYITGSQSFTEFKKIDITLSHKEDEVIAVVIYDKATRFSHHKTQEEYDNQRRYI